jgi:hypothetical protein
MHGGVANIGRHRTEDVHHSRTLAAARAEVRWPHRTDGRPGGLVRAATGTRLPNGRFAPNAALQPKRDRLIAKALAGVIATQKERRMAKQVSLRVVPDDPGIDGAAPDPRMAPPEARPSGGR